MGRNRGKSRLKSQKIKYATKTLCHQITPKPDVETLFFGEIWCFGDLAARKERITLHCYGESKVNGNFYKSYFFLINLSNPAMTPRAQSYLSYNYWSRVLGMSDEYNPDNYRDYFHKIDKIKAVGTELSY